MTQAINASGWPIVRGIQTVKDLSYLNMKAMSAAAALDKLWSDTFLTNAGIYAAGSANYTYQGTPNFNVIKVSSGAQEVPVMTNNTSPTGEASASSVYSSFQAFQAFDNNQSTYWQSSGAAYPQQLKYDFGSGITKIITSYIIDADLTYYPKAWTFEGSNNNTDWTILDTRTAQVFSGAHERKTFSFSNTNAYRYYRINISDGKDATYLIIYALEMYSAAPINASIVSVLALDLAANVTQVMMFADVTLGTGTAAYYVSTDDGSTWTAVTLETLATVPAGKQIRLKVELTGNAQLESWGVAV